MQSFCWDRRRRVVEFLLYLKGIQCLRRIWKLPQVVYLIPLLMLACISDLIQSLGVPSHTVMPTGTYDPCMYLKVVICLFLKIWMTCGHFQCFDCCSSNSSAVNILIKYIIYIVWYVLKLLMNILLCTQHRNLSCFCIRHKTWPL